MYGEFLVRTAVAGIGVAVAAALLGRVVVWRRMAYFGDASAHAATLGAALALVLAIDSAVAIKIVGVLLIAAMLFTSVVAARPIARTSEAKVVAAATIGGLSALVGLCAAYLFDIPAGPKLVRGAATISEVSGVFSALWRLVGRPSRGRLRRPFAALDHANSLLFKISGR